MSVCALNSQYSLNKGGAIQFLLLGQSTCIDREDMLSLPIGAEEVDELQFGIVFHCGELRLLETVVSKWRIVIAFDKAANAHECVCVPYLRLGQLVLIIVGL